MLTTLIVCLSNCAAVPMTRDDEIGTLVRDTMQLCHEMVYLKKNHCPEINPPISLQCITDIDRELPLKHSNAFKGATKLLQQQFANELPAVVATKFSRNLLANNNNAQSTCDIMEADNKKLLFQKFGMLQKLSKTVR